VRTIKVKTISHLSIRALNNKNQSNLNLQLEKATLLSTKAQKIN
jgi:hypothetical protein